MLDTALSGNIEYMAFNKERKHLCDENFKSTMFILPKRVWSFDHRIDFDNSSVIDKGSFRIRKTLEPWHTSATKHADNNSKPIPKPRTLKLTFGFRVSFQRHEMRGFEAPIKRV